MRHSETDRKAFWANEAAKKEAADRAEFLKANPDVGVLNSGRMYRIEDGEVVYLAA